MSAIERIKSAPTEGDVVEFVHDRCNTDSMVRVLCFVEDYVGYKWYGHGRYWAHLPKWKEMLEKATGLTVIQDGTVEYCPVCGFPDMHTELCDRCAGSVAKSRA